MGDTDTFWIDVSRDTVDSSIRNPCAAPADAMFISRRVELALLAIKHSVTAIYPFRENAEAGGLMSYGPDTPEINRQGGIYSGRILRGEKPANLPVMQASKFELVINLQAARVMGFEVPGTLLAIADEVIE